MRTPTGLLVLVLLIVLAACAPRQDNRSPAEIACAAQAEQVMAERNRARNLRLEDAGAASAPTIIAETDVVARFDRDAAFAERQRLTRECLQRAEATRPGQPTASPPPQGWSRPPALLRW